MPWHVRSFWRPESKFTAASPVEVWMDESGSSCSVRTTRKNGHTKTTRGMLKYDSALAKYVQMRLFLMDFMAPARELRD